MVGRAVKAQVDGERNRRPCRVLLAAVEADLYTHRGVAVSMLLTIREAIQGVTWDKGVTHLVRLLRLELLKDLE